LGRVTSEDTAGCQSLQRNTESARRESQGAAASSRRSKHGQVLYDSAARDGGNYTFTSPDLSAPLRQAKLHKFAD
jgi:hypothetical protein